MNEFFKKNLSYAQQASKATGIDPRIILAQGALESAHGKKAPGNNLFGIKSHGKKGGQNFTTHEVINGQRVKMKDNFRQYATPQDSFTGYADFINSNPRYKGFKGAKGLEAQAQALQASGYATDPQYGSKILQIAKGIKLDPNQARIEQAFAPQEGQAISPQQAPQQEAQLQQPYNPMDTTKVMQERNKKGLFGLSQQEWLAMATGFGSGDDFRSSVAGAAGNVAKVRDKQGIQQQEQARNEQLGQLGGQLGLTPEQQGQFALLSPEMQQKVVQERLFAKQPQRKIIKGADGYNYFEDGSRVLPDVQQQPSAPNLETLYDEQTGLPFKGQFNPETGGFDRVGGVKAPSNGITITNPDGTVTQIGGGQTGLGRKAQGQLESGIISNTELLDLTDSVAESFNPDFLTYKGQGEQFFSRQSEKLGVELPEVRKEFLKNRTQFVTKTERLFNAYRKEITGAAAAVQELDRLKKSFLNTDQSPSEFEATLSSYQDELKRTLRLRNKILREGFDPRSKDGGAKLDNSFLTGADDDIEARGNELEQQGKSEEEILATLEREGYEIE